MYSLSQYVGFMIRPLRLPNGCLLVLPSICLQKDIAVSFIFLQFLFFSISGAMNLIFSGSEPPAYRLQSNQLCTMVLSHFASLMLGQLL